MLNVQKVFFILLLYFKIYPVFNIIDGRIVQRGEFPSSVALIHTGSKKIAGGGTLISVQHVLCCAHQLTGSTSPFDFAVALGTLNISIPFSKDSYVVGVKKFIKHKEYNPRTSYADIALLFLNRKIIPSKFIKPVSLTPDSLLRSGVIIGYGNKELSVITDGSLASKEVINIKPFEVCMQNSSVLQDYPILPIYCALGSEVFANSGDSGSGFYVNINSSWYLQGIISFGDPQFDAFVSVANFTEWIYEKMEPSD